MIISERDPYCRGFHKINSSNPANLITIVGTTKPLKQNVKSRPTKTKLTYMNVGSVKNKATSIYDYILQSDTDIMAIAETWLYQDPEENTVHINELLPKGYKLLNCPRSDGRVGGGVAVVYRNSLKLTKIKKNNAHTSSVQFEHLECVVSLNKDKRSNINLAVVYRPQPTPINKLKVKDFWKDWKKFLRLYASSHKDFLIVGDLNFHLDNAELSTTKKFNSILDELNLTQLVSSPTHTAGHILDVVITKPDNSAIIESSVLVHDPGLSDVAGNITTSHHFAIDILLSYNKPTPKKKVIVYRRMSEINHESFKSDLINLDLESKLLNCTNPDEMVQLFNSMLEQLLDKHAPVITRSIIERPNTSWYNKALAREKSIKRRLERRWYKSGLQIHRLEYRKQCAAYNKLLSNARINDTQTKLAACNRDQGKLLKVCNSIIGMKKSETLVDGYNSEEDLANAFSSFFHEKVKAIHKELGSTTIETPNSAFSKLAQMRSTFNIPSLTNFDIVSQTDIEALIKKSNSKTCNLDVLPTNYFKLFSTQLSKPISIIINSSLQSGTVPSFFKNAVVLPTLKKHGLDTNDFSNYRPISNLPYLSKLLERSVFSQLERHLTENNLLPSSQSAYRKLHSTETSLLRVTNDILTALNNGNSTLLVTLDISAAFDTVNHQMLLDRYSERFMINGTFLAWMASYLKGRTQAIKIGSYLSNALAVDTGFPQGSVLGGPKYTMHTAPLDELITLHSINNQSYADDTNLYVSFDLRDAAATSMAFSQMEHCLADVHFWMAKNKLQLNCSKTVVVLFKPPTQNFSHHPTTLKVGTKHIKISPQFKTLGVILDKHMRLDKQVNRITKSVYLQIRKISKVRRQLNRRITETLVNTLVTSRLDYCNSLLCGVPKKTIKKLQCAQNASARLIMLAKKRDHVTPLLRELHWLPVTYRSDFKTLIITYKVLNGLAPQNINNLLTAYVPRRNLRSANQRFLDRPTISRNNFGKRAFANISVSLWNNLPLSVRKSDSLSEFKAKLKTHLFILHYGSN